MPPPPCALSAPTTSPDDSTDYGRHRPLFSFTAGNLTLKFDRSRQSRCSRHHTPYTLLITTPGSESLQLSSTSPTGRTPPTALRAGVSPIAITSRTPRTYGDPPPPAGRIASPSRARPASSTNTAPTAADGAVTTPEDTEYTFTAANFNFSDTDTGDALESVKITVLPSSGTLDVDGTPIISGDLPKAVSKADIDAAKLTYVPPLDASGPLRFSFKVNDGDADSASPYVMTVTITAVNDAPTVATVIPNQAATVGTAFNYAFPDTTFNDAEGDTLTYMATKPDNNALPTWLSFTDTTRLFSGTPAWPRTWRRSR